MIARISQSVNILFPEFPQSFETIPEVYSRNGLWYSGIRKLPASASYFENTYPFFSAVYRNSSLFVIPGITFLACQYTDTNNPKGVEGI